MNRDLLISKIMAKAKKAGRRSVRVGFRTQEQIDEYLQGLHEKLETYDDEHLENLALSKPTK